MDALPKEHFPGRRGVRRVRRMETKEAIHRKFRDDMQRAVSAPEWTVRERVALACRILHRDGHESALAGQVSARGDRPGTYWALSFGVGFDETTASNVLLVDDGLNVLDGEGMPNPANRFHHWIYRARPEVCAIVHTHAPYASALSLVGEALVVSHMDTCLLYENCAYLPEWPGVPIGDDEGRIISEALGDKPAVLLAHHGLLTAAHTIERATVLAFYLERTAKMQLLARSVGTIRPIDSALAREAREYRGSPKYIEATFNYLARSVLRESPECVR
jgi:L-fuculose-phosphate aldolase